MNPLAVKGCGLCCPCWILLSKTSDGSGQILIKMCSKAQAPSKYTSRHPEIILLAIPLVILVLSPPAESVGILLGNHNVDHNMGAMTHTSKWGTAWSTMDVQGCCTSLADKTAAESTKAQFLELFSLSFSLLFFCLSLCFNDLSHELISVTVDLSRFLFGRYSKHPNHCILLAKPQTSKVWWTSS